MAKQQQQQQKSARKNWQSAANANAWDALADTLSNEYSGLVETLNNKPSSLMDNGQADPSMLDMTLRIELSTICAFFHRQNHGTITVTKKDPQGRPMIARGKDGNPVLDQNGQVQYITTTYPNNKERLDESEAKMHAIRERGEEPSIRDYYYADLNQARFDHCEHMLRSFAQVYREIFREDWKPVDNGRNGPAKKVDLTAEEIQWAEKAKARWEARKAG